LPFYRSPGRHRERPAITVESTDLGLPTTDFLVSRALLRRGRVYEDAVGLFQPYREIQDENPEAREAMRVLLGRARENKQFLFLSVNNRLEGNAPLTILSLVDK
jgi:hypothetical protein